MFRCLESLIILLVKIYLIGISISFVIRSSSKRTAISKKHCVMFVPSYLAKHRKQGSHKKIDLILFFYSLYYFVISSNSFQFV